MNELVDALFEGDFTVAVADVATEYNRKAPGQYDSQGDLCAK